MQPKFIVPVAADFQCTRLIKIIESEGYEVLQTLITLVIAK